MSALFRVLAYSQPIDVAILGVQVLVLLMLAYQQFTRIIHKRRLDRQLSKLFYALAEGQELQAIAPDMIDEDAASFGKWKHAVRDWMDVTRKTLESCSGNAVISFMHNPDFQLTRTDRINARTDYESLIARLNNLRCIMEHMDAYYPR
jgi:nitrogen fixation/metabolism regulation signal transduction histidine kinase